MKFALFLAPGFEEGEAIITTDVLRRGGLQVELISITNDLEVKSAHDVIIKADKLLADVKYEQYIGYILPGGRVGVENLMKSEMVKDWLIRANQEEKTIAAVCAAPQILGHLGILDNREATSYPGCTSGMEKAIYNDEMTAITDGHIITGASVGSTMNFALAIADKILGAEKVLALQNELVIRD
ncbi:DJ-1 family glyoxalase III [Spiroplasma eriocheiris]|uniref:DJ-1 family protein n=1 Tax=Spiroplasma eriocheiris TaxID=315358 RepID=A0A0H3XJP0_9MOLU|nr:DJ-1 family glyoxalase III [Spiroplasma eriocheiris]AHF57622.1 putative ThiJ family intracellular protease [Spiroplasma eriocheiris CCTCC M 207170]AKM54076.1 DJ-1 family protein [Spiroplasma eriocheiris]